MPGDAASCWSCGSAFETATNMFGPEVMPSAGDATVCLYCGSIGVFTGTGIEQRRPTETERAQFMADERMIDLVGAVLTRLATTAGED